MIGPKIKDLVYIEISLHQTENDRTKYIKILYSSMRYKTKHIKKSFVRKRHDSQQRKDTT